MFVLRSVIYFIILFLVFESVALSAVLWSFYESTQNALKQESLLSDHRARDFTLAIAKATEMRLNQNGYSEINKTFSRYVEETAKDPEKFNLKEIRLYNPEGILLASSVEAETKDAIEKRKPNTEITKETYFRKAMRMRKWEWPEEDKDTNIKQIMSLPELPRYAKSIIRLFPHAKVNEAMIYAPVYHETKLDVLGAVFVVYNRGNLVLLFENQFDLMKWMFVNYSLIALLLSVFLWGIFFLFQYFTKREGKEKDILRENITVENTNLPLIQKKTLTNTTLEVSELKQVETTTIKEEPIKMQDEIQQTPSDVMDAIYLG